MNHEERLDETSSVSRFWGRADTPARNAAYLMAASVSGLFSSAVNTIVVARYLGADGFGQLSYSASLVGLVSPLMLLAFDAMITRHLLGSNAKGAVLGTAMLVRFVMALVCIGLLMALVPVAAGNDTQRRIIGWLSLGLLVQPVAIIAVFYSSYVRSRYVAAVQIMALMLAVGMRVALVLLQADIVWFAIAVFIDAVVMAVLLGLLGVAHAGSRFRQLSVDWRIARDLVRNSLPLMLAQLAIMLNLRIDQVMIGQMLDAAAVGQYAAAARLSEVWMFVPIAVSASFFPKMLLLTGRQIEQHRLTRTLIRFLVAVALVLVALTQLLASDIVHLLFGEDFSEAAVVLSIHIWSAIFIFASSPVNKLMTADNALWGRLLARSLAIAVNVLANWLLIPEFGIVGAAWATVLSYAAGWVLFYAVFPSTRSYFRIIMLSLLPCKPRA